MPRSDARESATNGANGANRVSTSWTVGELARRTGLTVRTLHHYDEIGLLAPSQRSGAGYRQYTARDVARLQHIQSLRALGFGLGEIRDCLTRPDFSPLRAVRLHLAALRQRITHEQEACERLEALAARLVAQGTDGISAEEFLRVLEATMKTDLPGLMRFARGKVRDIYAVGDDKLFVVSTDRVSAFDVVMPNPIPDRGKVLTQLSTFWFRQTGEIVPNHLIADDLASFPEPARAQAEVVEGRSMLVRRAKRIDIECVARGYLSGSAWSEYRKQGTACGITLPEGLVESQQLPEPIFTPTTKADQGHDLPLTFDELVERVGGPLAEQLRDVTLAVYAYAAGVALEKGIIIADTKLEFGLLGDELILIDELLTPDSSRFWDAAQYQPGKTPASFDKQYLRDWLDQSGWNKEPPAPELPEDVVANTRRRYVEALERLTGKGL